MDKAKAITKYVRISPRKARLVAGLIRGMTVPGALAQLQFCPNKASGLLKKTLDSAVANAEMQLDVRSDDLKVATVLVDEGPRLKRIKSKNRGGRHPILKRTSHFTVVVEKV